MGWASAGEIFDPIARALIDLGASSEVKRGVLTTLIRQLQDGDWDTEGESLDEFRNDPIVVEAFARQGVSHHPNGYGTIGFREGIGWVLHCEDCSPSQFEMRAAADDEGRGHDYLVYEFAAHRRIRHGEVQTVYDASTLINDPHAGRQQ